MNSSTRWRFTPQELLALWPQIGAARFPFPLQVRDSTLTVNERDAAAYRARAQLEQGGVLRNGRIDAEVEGVLRTLVTPLVWCTAFGYYGPQEHELIRVRAAHAGRDGVLAVQLSGPKADVGGDVILISIARTALAEAVVGALPAAPAGGSPAATLTPTSSSGGYRPVDVVASPAQRTAQRVQQLVQGPFDSAGQLVVNALDADGELRKLTSLAWFDRPGDGRYLSVHEPVATVRPIDSAALTAALHDQLSTLAQI